MAMCFLEERMLRKVSTTWLEEHTSKLAKVREAMKRTEGQNPVFIRLVLRVRAQLGNSAQ